MEKRLILVGSKPDSLLDGYRAGTVTRDAALE